MSFCGSNTGIEIPALLVNGIVNNALFHSGPLPHSNQILYQIIHILYFCPIDSLLNYAVVVTGTEVYGGHKSGSSYG